MNIDQLREFFAHPYVQAQVKALNNDVAMLLREEHLIAERILAIVRAENRKA